MFDEELMLAISIKAVNCKVGCRIITCDKQLPIPTEHQWMFTTWARCQAMMSWGLANIYICLKIA